MNNSIKFICLSIFISTAAHTMQNVNELGEQLLIAARTGDHHEVERLINAGAPVGYENNIATTALQTAATYGRLQCLEMLIAKKAQINQINKYGSTALTRAAEYDRLPCAKALIAAGAQVNLVNLSGWTPLMRAIYHSNYDDSPMCDLFVDAMLCIPNKEQKAKMVTFLGINKYRKNLGLDRNLRHELKNIWPLAVYENNKENFADSIAYHELMLIQRSREMGGYLCQHRIAALLEKYNPGGNNSGSTTLCSVQ